MTRRGVCVHVVLVPGGELRVVAYVSGKGASYRGLPINSPRRYVSNMRISEYAGQVGTPRKSIIEYGRNHSSREDLISVIDLSCCSTRNNADFNWPEFVHIGSTQLPFETVTLV